VTILGRGYGESIVLHLGDGNWIVIDSFEYGSGNVAPLDYLSRMGVSHDKIAVVLATHWHDDHVKGIAKVYEAAINAGMVFSSAFRNDEFIIFIRDNLVLPPNKKISSGLDELRRISDINDRRKLPLMTVGAAHIVYRKHPGETSFGLPVIVETLSPSQSDINSFLKDLGFTRTSKSTRIAAKRNPVSVVAWASIGTASALLGADLEETKHELRGWKAIVNSSRRPLGKASVFNIPHHGSQNAHSDEVWNQMIAPDSLAILAPWSAGASQLPTTRDVTRIKSRAGSAFSAWSIKEKLFTSDVPVVVSMLRSNGAVVKSLPKKYGFVQLRRVVRSQDGEWTTTLSDGARIL